MKEIWKDVIGYEGYYQVSNLGRVRSTLRKVPHKKSGFITIKSREIFVYERKDGYQSVCLSKNGRLKNFLIHRLVAISFLNYDDDSSLVVDHINSIKNDNRLENLQLISLRHNVSKAFSQGQNTSKFTGVHYVKTRNKWAANIQINGVIKNLGYYDSENEAHGAYLKKLKSIDFQFWKKQVQGIF